MLTPEHFDKITEPQEWIDSLVREYAPNSGDVDVALQNMGLKIKSLSADLQRAREEFADEVIELITTERAAMSRLYSKHEYGINKVCNRLKLFVGDLLKKETPS